MSLRIVGVADTHLFHDRLAVPDGDVFVHAGDLCRGGSLPELAQAAAWIRALPHATKIVVAGNHDWPFVRDRGRAIELLGPDVIYLEDSGLTIGGLSFWGSPWQPIYGAWAFNLERGAALAARWALIPDRVDVLITHGPPQGIGDQGPISSRAGCEELRARVEVVRPLLHLFGHIHQDGGLWQHDGVVFANVTTADCRREPTVIDVAAEDRRVHPVEVPPPAG
ncbi:MAG TPA: metallophosphatase domain-containing protein [Kofleriaceae bacterium]